MRAAERLQAITRHGLLTAECLVGDTVSGQICAHHERRLRRLGWERALDPVLSDWAEGEPSPRPAELAERIDVRVLVWAGAPLPLFRPSRHEVRRMRDELTDRTRIRCALDA